MVHACRYNLLHTYVHCCITYIQAYIHIFYNYSIFICLFCFMRSPETSSMLETLLNVYIHTYKYTDTYVVEELLQPTQYDCKNVFLHCKAATFEQSTAKLVQLCIVVFLNIMVIL